MAITNDLGLDLVIYSDNEVYPSLFKVILFPLGSITFLPLNIITADYCIELNTLDLLIICFVVNYSLEWDPAGVPELL